MVIQRDKVGGEHLSSMKKFQSEVATDRKKMDLDENLKFNKENENKDRDDSYLKFNEENENKDRDDSYLKFNKENENKDRDDS